MIENILTKSQQELIVELDKLLLSDIEDDDKRANAVAKMVLVCSKIKEESMARVGKHLKTVRDFAKIVRDLQDINKSGEMPEDKEGIRLLQDTYVVSLNEVMESAGLVADVSWTKKQDENADKKGG